MEQSCLTSKAYLAVLGKRARQYRIDYPLTQKELAEKSGVSLRSIQNFESGEDVQLGNFIKIVFALGLAEKLDLLIPDVGSRPSAFLQPPKERVRASRSKNVKKQSFVWGDEK